MQFFENQKSSCFFGIQILKSSTPHPNHYTDWAIDFEMNDNRVKSPELVKSNIPLNQGQYNNSSST